jgi:hypothetical protein
MNLKPEPKNVKLSIHNKYKRRLRQLSLTIDDFLHHVEMKLDRSIGGNIHNRQDIEAIKLKCEELAALLPDPADALDCPPIREDFLEALQQMDGETESIIANAESFLKGLSKEEWEEMAAAYAKHGA